LSDNNTSREELTCPKSSGSTVRNKASVSAVAVARISMSRFAVRRVSGMIKKPAVQVLIVALVLRSAFVLSLGPEPVKPLRDQQLYMRLAQSIASGDGLLLEGRIPGSVPEEHRWKTRVYQYWVSPEEPGLGVTPPGRPTALVEPLYPLLLGVGSFIWGETLLPPRLLQALLGALTAALATMILLKTGRIAAYAAGLGVAAYPHLVYYTGVIATETAYIFLQMLMFFAWYRLIRHPSTFRALLFGAAAGASFLTRSSILPVFCIAIFLIILSRKAIFRSIVISVIGFFILTSPWIIRNGSAVDSYRLMPTKGGLNLWMQNHPGIQQLQLERIGTPIPDHMLRKLSCRELEEFPSFADSIPEVERDRILTRRALRYISCNPRYFLYMCWLRMKWYLRLTGSSVRGPFVDMVGSLSFAFLLFMGAYGILAGQNMQVIHLVGLTYCAYLAAHTVFHGGVRYRLPADSILILSAAVAIQQIIDRVRREHSG